MHGVPVLLAKMVLKITPKWQYILPITGKKPRIPELLAFCSRASIVSSIYGGGGAFRA